ncbi:MAG: hypothetical protein HC883_06200 [Bdellovibrionaceae bacterium]|nr:hypothetical protein [Pseudobdellovibrionaceae bacterium]
MIRGLIEEINPRAAGRGIDISTQLFDIGALDSYSTVQLVLGIEERLEISMDYNDVIRRHFRSIRALKKLLIEKYGCEDSDSAEIT